MKVLELIEKLQKFPHDAKVYIADCGMIEEADKVINVDKVDINTVNLGEPNILVSSEPIDF